MTPLNLVRLLENPRYSFYRPFYEKNGYIQFQKDGKLYLLLNILGMNIEDIEYKPETDEYGNPYLVISGKNHNEFIDKNFDASWKFPYNRNKKIANLVILEEHSKNGLLFLEIEFDEPVKPEFNIIKK